MNNKNTEREYELKAQLRELETQRDELDVSVKAIWQQEDDRDTENITAHRMLDHMVSVCSARDKIIGELIEEKQQMLCEMKHQRLEFSAEFESEISKKKQKLDWEMEDARMKLTSILKQQEAEKEQTDKDDVDGVESDDRE